MPVHALLLEQLGMGALLQHLALTKDIDDVGTLDGSETVRHGHRGPALGHALEGCLDEFLALCYIFFTPVSKCDLGDKTMRLLVS
jgi:hypothetical protein